MKGMGLYYDRLRTDGLEHGGKRQVAWPSKRARSKQDWSESTIGASRLEDQATAESRFWLVTNAPRWGERATAILSVTKTQRLGCPEKDQIGSKARALEPWIVEVRKRHLE